MRFDAFMGNNNLVVSGHPTGPVPIAVGQSKVLDGVQVTVVANWTNPPYRSNAVDVRFSAGTP